jgi:ferredoxin-NADP reductase
VPARPETMPPDLFGQPRTDRFLRGLTALSAALRPTYGSGPAQASEPTSAWRTLIVARRDAVCRDVVTLELADPDGAPLPPWDPGAHLRLELPSGRIRHYSMCGPYTIAIRLVHNGGGGSAEIHDSVHPGTRLRVRDPRNGFPFAGEPRPYFVAGGIGITPLLPMIQAARRRSLDWRLVYRGTDRDRMPFLDQLDSARTEVLMERGDLLESAPDGAAVYCCGPAGMIDAVRAAADTDPRITAFRYERFTAAPIVDGHRFEVELARSGAVLEIPPHRSVLDEIGGYSAAYGCRQGFCGTCAQRVLSGAVEHRGSLPAADGEMLVCVSRAAEGERLVLDL